MGLFKRTVTPSKIIQLETQRDSLSMEWGFIVSGQREQTIKTEIENGTIPGDIAAQLEEESTIPKSGVFLIRARSFDAENLQHGPYKRCYDNGVIKEEGTYEHGVPHGPFTTYHKNGQLAERGQHHYGIPVGTYERFYAHGRPAVLAHYDEEGKKHGAYREYHMNGALAWDLSYEHGKPTGTWKWYNDKGGLIKQQGHDEDGKKHGTVERFFDDGRLKERITFFHDEEVLSPDNFYCERNTKTGYSHQSTVLVAHANGADTIRFGYEEPGLG